MLRLLGFLIGSAVALSLMLIITGRIEPSDLDGTGDDVERVAQNAVAAIQDFKDELQTQSTEIPTTPVGPVRIAMPEQEPEPVPEPQPAPEPEPASEPEPVQDMPMDVGPVAPGETDADEQTVNPGYDDGLFEHRVSPLVKDPETELPLDEQMQAEGLLWHVFWDPFRSELAATGFIEQLETVTPLNYGVIRRKIGVYEVAFAYADEDDLEAGLLAIEQATGMSFAEWQQ